MIILLVALLIVSVLLEGVITTLLLKLLCLICFTIIKRDTSVFLLAFASGLIIDGFRVQQAGATSIFSLCFLLFILLYKKKYEIYSAPFVLIATFFGSFLFLLTFGLENILQQSFIAALVALILFSGIRVFLDTKLTKQKEKFLPLS